MIVIRWDKNKDTPEEVIDLAKAIRYNTEEDVICIPSTMDILFNSSVEDLKAIRNQIDEFIKKIEDEI